MPYIASKYKIITKSTDYLLFSTDWIFLTLQKMVVLQ